MANFCRFVFYNNVFLCIHVEITLKIARARKSKKNCAPSGHFYWLSVVLPTIALDRHSCARNHHYQYHISFFLFTDQVTLLFVGDITFSGPVRYYVEHNHQSYNTCFVEVASFIRGADISVANLETPLVNATVFSHKCQKQVVLDSSPQSASSLR